MASPTRKQPAKQEFDEVHNNTSTSLINITVDKLKLILTDHIKRVEKSTLWQVPLSLFVTILIVLCTAEFKSALGLEKSVWQALFIISGFLSAGWLLWSLFKFKQMLTIDELVNKIIDKQSGK